MNLPRFNEANYAHFVTTKTFQNKLIFNNSKSCELLLKDIDFYRNKLGFKLIGYVIMPNHLHLIVWWDVEGQKGLTISKIIQSIKSHSAKEIAHYLKTGRRKPSLSPYSTARSEGFVLPSRRNGGSQLPNDYQWVDKGNVHTPITNRIWQLSFYDFNIYSDEKLQQKLDYIHYNPVRAGLVQHPEDYQYSSARNYLVSDHSVFTIDRIEL